MILIDSCVFVAYTNTKDQHHEKAVEILKDVNEGTYGRAFFSDYIFSEVLTVILLRVGFDKAKEFGSYLLSSEFELLRVDEKIFKRTWEIFCEVQNMSFTDCTNLALVEVFEIKKIATFDKGFLGKV
ncbi:MAG: hypothetical protein AYK19_08910 [Theionarchaea archaeon DG-70-1]|nr:MAG: hypothetical protein AYK19_08910 [Theionarchaea archaeon DG-70-1]